MRSWVRCVLLSASCQLMCASSGQLDRVAEIDALVQTDWHAAAITPAPIADDWAWLRRVFLDIIGRQPSLAESDRYLGDGSLDRDRVVADLLAHPGRVHRDLHFWADQLRVQSRVRFRDDGEPYLAWLRQTLTDNRPYDDWVRDLITAEGSAWQEGNGATGFYLRDAGMPDDHMANTMQVFLGTAMACAQCHDHPFDRWTRHEFLALTAFTHGTQAGRPGRQAMQDLRRVVSEADLEPATAQQLRQLARQIHLGVLGNDRGVRRLPEDYQYDDGEPGERISAAVPFGSATTVGPDDDPRAVFAAWLTDPDNPRFTRVIVNRLWARVFGVGLFEPIDQITDTTRIDNPALLQLLEECMRELDYDLVAFQALLYRSDLYRRQAVERSEPASPWHFPGPLRRRLDAEQIWDGLVVLADPAIDQRPNASAGPARYQALARLAEQEPEDLIAVAGQQAELRQRRSDLGERGRQLRQAMQSAQADQDRQAVKRLRGRLRELGRERRALRQAADAILGMESMRRARPGQDRGARGLVRAADLPSPAPAGHFLARFGQSDRELIDNSIRVPTVPQVLDLLNGTVDRHLLGRGSELLQQLAGEPADRQVARAFQAILVRPPDPDEAAACAAVLAAAPEEGLADLIWALINTPEFLFYP